jgi:hypothetical protein
MTYYVNQDKAEYSQQELIDLLMGIAKPMWTCRTYEPEYVEDGILAETLVDDEEWNAYLEDYGVPYESLESPYIRQEFRKEVLAIAEAAFACRLNAWENMTRSI